jgi:hypothetical protein
MDEFRRVCHKSFLKQIVLAFFYIGTNMHMLVIEKKISIGILSVSAKATVPLFPRNPLLAGLKMHNMFYSRLGSATLLFFLLVPFEVYYFTRKNTKEWIILERNFICSDSSYIPLF